ncbi:MAG: hypothetical protein ACOZHQ_03980 [Thermodesulfobacteriota bacterium]
MWRASVDSRPGRAYTAAMLKLKDLHDFKQFLASGGWADAFAHAEEELRLEMIEKVEELLETADVADKVVGEVLFSKDGMAAAGSGASGLDRQAGED